MEIFTGFRFFHKDLCLYGFFLGVVGWWILFFWRTAVPSFHEPHLSVSRARARRMGIRTINGPVKKKTGPVVGEKRVFFPALGYGCARFFVKSGR